MNSLSSNLRLLKNFEVRDNDIVLRRFISGEKFFDLLDSQALYFPPASEFSDTFEGHLTNLDNRLRTLTLKSQGFNEAQLRIADKANASVSKDNGEATVISCWTKNGTDHQRMWFEYTGNGNSVAIESTVGRLRQNLGCEFLIIAVRYIDFDTECIPFGHSLFPFFYKRVNDYKWENEVRIIGNMEVGKRMGSSRRVTIDLGSLIRGVTISPNAPSQFVKEVRSALGNVVPQPVIRQERR